ncbi:hypothetical protein [Nocardioides sp. MH1]|uniref:hypothetical protein n=1 Tax=Nocardioides sp. MH1 TaxID=3242490 RepID=UPI003520B769
MTELGHPTDDGQPGVPAGASADELLAGAAPVPKSAALQPATPTDPAPGRPSAAEVEALLAGAKPVPKEPYRDRKREHKLQRQIDEHDLRKRVAKYTYVATAVQIGIADAVFVMYAWWGVSWSVPTEAIAAWLGATVIQVIAVLLVITRYLFPDGGRRSREKPTAR